LAFALTSGCSAPDPTSTAQVDDSPAARVILVTGATGTQGGAVARELIERGYRVRALTRSPEKPAARALADLGAVVLRGNFDDPASLDAAMSSAYGVFAVTDFWEHGYEKEVAHGRQLIDAALQAGIEHFVYTSVAGADESTGIPHFDSKYEVERYLKNSGLAFSIVRPVSFMDGWRWERDRLRSGIFADPRDPANQHQYIAARDIGFFVGEAFDQPEQWLGRAEDIAGDQLPLVELVKLFSAKLERPVRYERIPWSAYEAENGAELTIMMRWFDRQGYSVDIAELRQRYPNLMTAEQFLRQLGWEE
jgi:uncharacterized protein YbjT (DUF2867 family)